MTEQRSRFLTIPLEVRQIIYSKIFDTPTCIAIEAAQRRTPSPSVEPTTTSWSAEDEFWAIESHQLSSQLLRTCRQIHTETLPHLYSLRKFDLTAQESLKLFLHNIGPQNFAFIRHVVIDWDFLQDLGWSLSKDEYKLATSGLSNVEIKSWRMRHLTGTSIQWRNVKSHERSLCQAALDICQKHERLKVLAESYHRRASSSAGMHLSGSWPLGESASRSNCRVKWRFVTCVEDLMEDETIVAIEKDIDLLRITKEEESDGESERCCLQVRYALHHGDARLVYIDHIPKKGKKTQRVVFGLILVEGVLPTIQYNIRKKDKRHSASLKNLTTLAEDEDKLKTLKYLQITIPDCARQCKNGKVYFTAARVINKLTSIFRWAHDAITLEPQSNHHQNAQTQSQQLQCAQMPTSTKHNEPKMKPTGTSQAQLSKQNEPGQKLIKFGAEQATTVARPSSLTLPSNFFDTSLFAQIETLGAIIDADVPPPSRAAHYFTLTITGITSPSLADTTRTRIVHGVLLWAHNGRPVSQAINDAMVMYMRAVVRLKAVRRVDEWGVREWEKREENEGWKRRVQCVEEGWPFVRGDEGGGILVLARGVVVE